MIHANQGQKGVKKPRSGDSVFFIQKLENP